MLTLNWIGKEAVVNHHLQVPFHLLKDVLLTRAVLAELPPFDGPKVVYCAGCLLGHDKLQSERIVVRQTPYEIR